ncbi:arylformamidase [Shimazuella sp. AN120528]|uniref:arylformamidase n=1 Tax=Shimazuella soli TaxID=1892854 RepID=UPI001F0D02CA|nr:arylformamidase [Shimazuella soli]MCH5584246.1 arylformamidase [Shimazuella soli]
MKIYDISEPLYNGMTVWPGDKTYHYELTSLIESDSCANVGHVSFSTHTGTHIDAPYHFDNSGKKTHELDLSLYFGPCKVIHLFEKQSITIEDLQSLHLHHTQRLLIRTDSWKDRTSFPTSFTYLEPEIATYLQSLGIKLIGVDVPSVDPADSETLPSHLALHQSGIHILERVVLKEVPAGNYELSALPLPIVGGDGSPVRAVLRSYSAD